jgi:hypothetical protein
MPNGLPFRLTDYLKLVDWTRSILRDDKRGAIPEDVPAILEQLNIDPKHWCYLSSHFESEFKSLVGTAYHVKAACELFGQQWGMAYAPVMLLFRPSYLFSVQYKSLLTICLVTG